MRVRPYFFLIAIPTLLLGQAGPVVQPQDPNYRALRQTGLGESFAVSSLTLQRDAGTIELKSGTVTFFAPVMGKVTGAVFQGSGTFTLKPGNFLESRQIRFRLGEDTINDTFDEMVMFFADGTSDEIRKTATSPGQTGKAAEVLAKWRKALRRNPENPQSFAEAITSGEDIQNLDAELLAELYSPSPSGLFGAYFNGKKYKGLRYTVKPRGSIHALAGNDEVAVVNVDAGSDRDGILYLARLGGKLDETRVMTDVDVVKYDIDTTVAKNKKLNATATVTFKAQKDGARVVRFGLMPRLRVSKASSPSGTVTFIQEPYEEDSALYVVMPEGMKSGTEYSVTIAYAGDKVIEGEGGGNFSVGARTSWYPSVASFSDYALYDLTFHSPKNLVLVGTGTKLSETKQGDEVITKWKTSVPVAVAGFNFGEFKSKEIKDTQTQQGIEGFATKEVPDFIKAFMGDEASVMSPVAMMDKTMSEAQASMQIFTNFFGPSPYGRIAITQQPALSYGQSWPTLVYLPVTAFLDSTQRWRMFEEDSFAFAKFIQEVTPHEVAHQWWGHIVGWSSYRDQWLSEGFADFSASVFLQLTNKTDKEYRGFLKRWSDGLLQKQAYGMNPNDVGPISTGYRLVNPKAGGVYNAVVYNKGGMVLHMLRSLMWHSQTGDTAFRTMMHEFVKTYAGGTASTDDFKRMVEKHIQPHMNLDGNGKMDWFFNQWVHGTEVPRYKLTYTLTPQGTGSQLTMKLAQSGVSDNFKMPTRVYASVNDRMVPILRLPVLGNKETDEIKITLPFQPKEISLNYNYDVLAYESTAVIGK